MKAKWSLVLLLFLPLAALAEIRLVDALEREVVLKEPAQRIVSLAPHITEVVYAAGAGDLLVGAVSYSDYPEAAQSVPRVGSYETVSYETLVDLEPDLILAWHSGNGAETVKRLEELGLPVFVQEPRTLEGVAQTLLEVGLLSGNDEQGRAASEAFLARLSSLRSRYSQQTTVDVYYQIWNDPLLTLNGEHLISDVIRLCGGRNAFAKAQPMVSRLSIESILSVDPMVILASGMGEERPEWLDDWQEWPSLQAVARGQLYYIHPDLLQRHTPRIMDGAAQLCVQLEKARRAYGL